MGLTLADAQEWVPWVRQKWFDGTQHKREIADAKLKAWGMTEPVTERVTSKKYPRFPRSSTRQTGQQRGHNFRPRKVRSRSAWKIPPYVSVSGDTFDERYGEW